MHVIGNMDKIVKESKIRINELESAVFKAKSIELENQYLSQSLQGDICIYLNTHVINYKYLYVFIYVNIFVRKVLYV
jgi:hypothetical protein